VSAEQTADRPVLRVVSGNPTPEEIAALVAVVAAAGSAPTRPTTGSAHAGWAAHDRTVRQPLAQGGWRAAAFPR
jgi:hypothetical protein